MHPTTDWGELYSDAQRILRNLDRIAPIASDREFFWEARSKAQKVLIIAHLRDATRLAKASEYLNDLAEYL